MRTVSIFKNGGNQAIRLPKEFQFDGLTKLEISRQGDAILLRPPHPSWLSFKNMALADDDFLFERADVVSDGDFQF